MSHTPAHLNHQRNGTHATLAPGHSVQHVESYTLLSYPRARWHGVPLRGLAGGIAARAERDG